MAAGGEGKTSPPRSPSHAQKTSLDGPEVDGTEPIAVNLGRSDPTLVTPT